jgi:hypothetical protein
MNIPAVPPVAASASTSPGAVQTLLMVAASFDLDLPVGSMFEGKVARALEPGRYTAELGGRQVAVEVQQAFNAGDSFRGRRLAAGPRPAVELFQIRSAADAARPAVSAAHAAAQAPTAAPAYVIRRLFAAQGLELDVDELAHLVAEIHGATDLRSVVGAGLLLRRSGARISRERIQSVLEQLGGNRALNLRMPGEALSFDLPVADEQPAESQDHAAFIAETAQALDHLVDGRRQLPAFAPTAAGAELAQLALPGATCATLDVTVAGHSVRTDVLMQDESGFAEGGHERGAQSAALTLHAGMLGPVRLEMHIAEGRLSIMMKTDEATAAAALEEHDAALRRALAGQGFAVDALRYGVRAPGEPDAVAAALLERVMGGAGLDLSV